ncbi:uncharacterized protein LOC135219067 [Macrobrachium nipponense]|uniref:uncharacterized protein LOC135219067 n=1 Tax=Macrobrachium nipponense TaxID=159736 RepID=UPI0030C8696D
MAVPAILLLLLFVPLGSWAREHLQFAPGKTLPGDLVDYWVTDASSQCVCRIMCIRNISCSGVTVQYNGAQLTCEFSHDEVLVENLVARSDGNTWIFNATTTTTTPAATTTTTSATITTTPSTFTSKLTSYQLQPPQPPLLLTQLQPTQLPLLLLAHHTTICLMVPATTFIIIVIGIRTG